MDNRTQRVRRMFDLAAEDARYVQMREEYLVLQKRFEEIVSQLSAQEQDILWDFVCLSDAMNWRMLEVIGERFFLEA